MVRIPLRLLLALSLVVSCGRDAASPPTVSKILVAPDSAFVPIGASQQLSASVRSSDGSILSSLPLAWASTDTSVATVSGGGLVTARAYGSTAVTATSSGVIGRAYVVVTGKPGLSVVSGGGVTDTANAKLAQPLVVEVRDTRGLPISGVRITFVSSIASDASCPPGFCDVPQVNLTSGASATDALGRLAYAMTFNRAAGPAFVAVSAPTLGLTDTARFTIQPGRLARVTVLPKDSAVYAGNNYALRAIATDRSGNPRPDAVLLREVGSAAALDGKNVRGVAFGRATVVATAGAAADTAFVSVVPQATIVAFAYSSSSGETDALYMFNLDGSNFHEIRKSVVGAGYFGSMAPDWLSSTTLVYHDNSLDHTKQLYVYDVNTGTASRFLSLQDRMAMENYPQVSRDGAWVYFGGGSYDAYWVYRARADGTGKQRISPAGAPAPQWAPTPSPDGTQVAYVSKGTYDVGQLEVITLATGQVRSLGVKGTRPRWSPDGAWIAYFAQAGTYYLDPAQLAIVRPDGTGAHPVANTTTQQFDGVDWSPDGKYLISAAPPGRLSVVELSSGTEVLVTFPSFTRTFGSPVWKR